MTSAHYVQALEEQLALIRWLDSDPSAAALFREQFESRQPFLAQMFPTVEDLAGFTCAALLTASPYYCAPELCTVIEQVGMTLPDHWRPVAETFQTRSGFLWFARPLPLPTWEDRPEPLVALTWRLDPPDHKYASLTIYTGGPLRGGRGDPTTSFRWLLGETLGQTLAVQHGERDLKIHNLERHDRKVRLAAGALAFLEQEIVTTEQHRAPRPTRRRAEAILEHDATIRVVLLRRKRSTHGERDAAGGPIEWSCQWVVRGHWRDQWYPSLGCHRPIWIVPYVKGPEEKPLREAATKLFAVVR